MKKYLPIFLLNFVNVIGFSLLIPVLPEVVVNYVPQQFAGIAYGFLISVYSFCQFLSAPILGALSDKYGRRPLLFVSQFGTMISWVIFGLAYFIPQELTYLGISIPFAILSISRIVDGLTGGNISVADAWISDITENSKKNKVFGLMGAVFGFGFLVGPAIGGFTSASKFGYLGTAIFAFLLSLITLLFIAFKLPESLSEENKTKNIKISLKKELLIISRIKEFKNNNLIIDLLVLKLFFAFVFTSYSTVFALVLGDIFNLDAKGIGLTMSVIGVFSIFNQAVLSHRIAKKFGDLNTLYISFACIGLGLFSLPFMPQTMIFFLINAFFINAGISFAMPTFKSLFTKNVAENQQGKITGIDESLRSLGSSISPLISGTLYSFFSIIIFPFYGLVMALPLIGLKFIKRNKSK